MTERKERVHIPTLVSAYEPGIAHMSSLLALGDEKISQLLDDGVDEESLFVASTVFEHPERTALVLDFLASYKPHIADRAHFLESVRELLNYHRNERSDRVQAVPDLEPSEMKDLEERIHSILDFFRPVGDSSLSTVRVMRNPPERPRESGMSLPTGPAEVTIVSAPGNEGNFEHEFCHSLINPLVEELAGVLTQEQQQQILAIASPELKRDYGEHWQSLLAEELIRTYVEYVKPGRELPRSDEIVAFLTNMEEYDFHKALQNKHNFASLCRSLGISTHEHLVERADEVAEASRNLLRERIYTLFKQYESSREHLPGGFREFCLNNLSGVL